MTVHTFTQPDFTTQTAAQYKANIDRSIAVISEIGTQFAPRQMAIPGMGISVTAGLLMDGTVVNSVNITDIGAPTEQPRIDRIYYDLNSRTFQRVVGTESETPVPPQIPYGVFPVCSIHLTPTDTVITNTAITDERTFIMAPVAFLSGDSYTSIVDSSGLLRIIIGKPGVDNRVIIRLQDDGGAGLEIQNSSGLRVALITADGNMSLTGVLTENAT